MLTIEPIEAFSDNYIWAIRNDRVSKCAVVDPGDAKPVIKYLKDNNLELSAILITHHHFDHTGGIHDLKSTYHCPVYGPINPKIEGIDHRLAESDQVHLESIDVHYKVIEVPGHTLDHITFVGEDHIFCGDTLFAGGCGRLFEGKPSQMWESLQKLANLPPETRVYCAHEYTLANLKFARTVDPDNPDLKQRVIEAQNLRTQDTPTVPSTIGLELETNPFLRAQVETIKHSAETYSGQALSTPEDVFAVVRQWKDSF